MNPELLALESVIRDEILAYQKLLSLSKEKKSVLIKNEVEKLNEIVLQEQDVLGTIKESEKTRTDSVDVAAKALGLPQEGIEFQTIIDAVPEADGQQLAQLKSEFKAVIAELARINTQNKMLLKTHIHYSAFFMDALTNHLKGLNTYSPSGHVCDAKEQGHVWMDRSV